MPIKCDVCGEEHPVCVHKNFRECDDCEGKAVKIIQGLDELIKEFKKGQNEDCWKTIEITYLLSVLARVRRGEVDSKGEDDDHIR